MAPIPLSLTLSNSSTILTWLCVYVPHYILVSLLFVGVVSIVVLAVLCLLGLYWLLKNLFDSLRSWSQARRPLPTPSSRPKAAGRLRSDSRHFSCPEYLPLLRCPHCFAEIRSLAAPAHPNSPRNPEIPPSPQPVLKRRSSDTPPTNPARCSPPSPLLLQEPCVTTPPRGGLSPRKEYVRRSPRPHKPRKFDD